MPITHHMDSTRGDQFARLCIAIAAARGEKSGAAAIAQDRWGPHEVPTRILKAAVAAGSLSGWGAEWAGFQAISFEFFSRAISQSLLGRMAQDLRRVPLQVRVISTVNGATAHWVGEAKPVPAGSLTFAQATLEPAAVAAMVVCTDEMLKSDDSAVEAAIRDDLIAAAADTIDAAFIDPSNAGSGDIIPAAITHGAPAVSASGDMKADLAALINAFQGDFSRAWLVMNPRLIAALAATQAAAFSDLDVRSGGLLAGIPVAPSRMVPGTIGSPADSEMIALVDAGGIAAGDGDQTEISVSRQATIQMLDSPTQDGSTGTGSSAVSLFQANAVGIRVNRAINWKVGRPGAVAVLNGIDVTSLS
jgi:HK97 family phage major capsid protein